MEQPYLTMVYTFKARWEGADGPAADAADREAAGNGPNRQQPHHGLLQTRRGWEQLGTTDSGTWYSVLSSCIRVGSASIRGKTVQRTFR